ncbi:MAG: outer membrane protein assembly factor BamE [Gammaproteobacteria bacterium]|nr:outer membrane protein assembly factor BamE [Gammaproteobacteria bacterium]
MRYIIISSLITFSFLLTSCSWIPDLSYIGLPRVHKIDIPQGNFVEQDKINQLRPGMNKQQVKFLMGTPMLDDSFHDNRWDYLYRFKPGYGEIEKHQATLYFNKQGKLDNIQGTFRHGDKAENIHNTTEIVVVPLDDYVDLDAQKKTDSYWKRMTDFFSWSDEHKGIPTGEGTPVGGRGEGEVNPRNFPMQYK